MIIKIFLSQFWNSCENGCEFDRQKVDFVCRKAESESHAEPEPEIKAEPEPETKAEPEPEPKSEPEPSAESEPTAELEPKPEGEPTAEVIIWFERSM